MRPVGICYLLVCQVKINSCLFPDLFHMLKHTLRIFSADSFCFNKVFACICFRLGLQLRIQLETVPGYFHLLFVGKFAKCLFKVFLSDITKRATNVAPDINIHILILN